jgi:hypothetical protein
MSLKGKLAVLTHLKTTVDIIDLATDKVIQQHDAQGHHNLGGSSVQENIAAIAVVSELLQHCVHVMNLKTGKLLSKFLLPNGKDARVALGKDTFTLVVGTDIGLDF